MSGPGSFGSFSISPASAAGAAPVTLTIPASGYTAHAWLSDPCGNPLPAPAYLTVAGRTATPHHLPAGTSFVDWQVAPAHPSAGGGGKVSLILASRQTVGTPTTCPTGPSPYGAASGTKPSPATTQPASSGLVTAAPRSGADTVIGAVFVAVLLACAVYVVWRLRKRGAR